MGSMFETLAQGASFDALVRTHGRLSTASDAITIGATAGAQTAVDAVWIEEEVDPQTYDDSRQEVGRGSLTLDPADASGIDTTWLAVIDSTTWPVERIVAKSPRLVLELVRYVEKRAGGGLSYRRR